MGIFNLLVCSSGGTVLSAWVLALKKTSLHFPSLIGARPIPFALAIFTWACEAPGTGMRAVFCGICLAGRRRHVCAVVFLPQSMFSCSDADTVPALATRASYLFHILSYPLSSNVALCPSLGYFLLQWLVPTVRRASPSKQLHLSSEVELLKRGGRKVGKIAGWSA